MDTSVMAFLELDCEAAVGPEVSDVLDAALALAPFRALPSDVTCVQGAFVYSSVVHASRGNLVLFVAKGTGQFGIGLASASDTAQVGNSVQYPNLETALRVFLLEPGKFPGDEEPDRPCDEITSIRR